MSLRVVNTFEGGTNGASLVAGVGNGTGQRNGNAWDTILGSASATFDSSTFVHGSKSLKLNFGGSPVTGGVNWTEATITASPTTAYLRFYFKIGTLPSANARLVVFGNAGGGSLLGAVVLQTDGKISLLDSTVTTRATSTTVLTTGQWCRLEVKLVSDAAVGSMDVRLFVGSNNESSTPDETVSYASQNTNGSAIRWVNVGSTNAVASLVLWVDSIEYNDFNWPGAYAPAVPAQYETLFANGTYPFMTPNVTTSADATNYSFGMYFHPTVAGKVYGAAWCNPVSSTSAESGTTPQIGLYPGPAGGSTALATKTTTATERRGQWNYELFTTPISVTANTDYMIVVFRQKYPAETYYFDVSNGGHGVQTQAHLVATDSTTTNNCFFDTGASIAKPASTFHSNWYGIDVLFIPTATGITAWGVPLA